MREKSAFLVQQLIFQESDVDGMDEWVSLCTRMLRPPQIAQINTTINRAFEFHFQ